VGTVKSLSAVHILERRVAQVRADLSLVPNVLEDPSGGSQDLLDRMAPSVGREHDRAVEDDVVRQQSDHVVDVAGLDGSAERVHRGTT
jgi:hypothetical protein